MHKRHSRAVNPSTKRVAMCNLQYTIGKWKHSGTLNMIFGWKSQKLGFHFKITGHLFLTSVLCYHICQQQNGHMDKITTCTYSILLSWVPQVNPNWPACVINGLCIAHFALWHHTTPSPAAFNHYWYTWCNQHPVKR